MAARKKSAAAPRKVTVDSITPFFWYDHQAEEAATFYTSLFPNSRITEVSRMGEGTPAKPAPALVVAFELAGRPLLALNGGKYFKLSPAASLLVNVRTQKDVDYLWETLSKGGSKSQCGWLVDRYGLSWQIVPTRFHELIADEDPEKVGRVMAAMMKMRKFDIAKLEAAYAGK